ncbi:hypothetical protein [Geodermatophilus nigrescens]|uniref:Uncharacterized protein n=1 Tax=Geodermatophilus nigrescens TaxID=1070870 RepID=A0A1M5JQ41_9ACTN|nr:hypothetical protein [Geodermatophilus nigrescens]SHG42702.1 hypothetical protein SAMN05444351_2605 [Geodermatophilus nigrescens]
MRLFPMFDAKGLAEENQKAYEELLATKEEAEQQAAGAQMRLDAAYRKGFDTYLSPFAAQFARLRNVELSDLPTITAVPELKAMDVKLRDVGFKAVDGLAALAGGSAAGAAAGGLTFAAVGALAAASTGTAISALSGAAATSATLAWLGGGSLAAGGLGVAGGTAVLAGVVAAPAVLIAYGVMWWKGEEAYQQQVKVQQELEVAKSEMAVQVAKVDAAVKRIKDTCRVVRALGACGRPQLKKLTALIDTNDDYAAYTPAQRALVAELAGVAQAMAAVIACPIVDEDGRVTAMSDRTITAATKLADRLAA